MYKEYKSKGLNRNLSVTLISNKNVESSSAFAAIYNFLMPLDTSERNLGIESNRLLPHEVRCNNHINMVPYSYY
jgi:hypothetical protein